MVDELSALGQNRVQPDSTSVPTPAAGPRPRWWTDCAKPQASGAEPAKKPGHPPTRHCPAATVRTSSPDLNRWSNRSTREASPGRRVEQFARCRGTTSSKSSAPHLADKSAHRHARVPRPLGNRLVTRYTRRLVTWSPGHLVTWSPSCWLLSALDIVTFTARAFARKHARHLNSRPTGTPACQGLPCDEQICCRPATSFRRGLTDTPTRREEPARKTTWPPGST